MPSETWPANVLNLLTVPNFKDVYVVGCFAKCVTLYSQQVRALNLIAALRESKVITPGREVIVIGAGATGLTASAAAASLGARVTIVDELDGPMQLQYNNRQRWIHPYVYDWPTMQRDNDDSTHLPILNWTAAYADSVAEQIHDDWLRIVNETGRITQLWNATASVQKFNKSTYVHWTVPHASSGHATDPVTILAVGFGLEEEKEWSWSYWSEDDIDGSFRKPEQRPKWLVSGYGDGALTDVMRLCLRRFRHHKILDLLQGAKELDTVRRDLEDIQKKEKSAGETWVHESFLSLATGDLGKSLRANLRTDGPRVYLTGRSPLIYGPGSSLLNRLIVRLLEKEGAVEYVLGKPERFNDKGERVDGGGTGTIKRVGEDFVVELANGNKTYQRVILRHGPFPPGHARMQADFKDVHDACPELIKRWKQIIPSEDPTRTPKWPIDFLPAESPKKEDGGGLQRYLETIDTFELHAKSMSVYKELRADGGSTVTYQIDGLSVDRGKLEGIWCHFEFTTGVIGKPKLDAAAQQLGVKWIPDHLPPLPSADGLEALLEAIRERGRSVSGTFQFGRPLHENDPAVNLGFSIEVLNGDALSSWEFQELYPTPAQRVHINYEPIHDLEYLGRTVWFPIEKLRIRLKLPQKITSTPYVSLFECEKCQEITRGEIAPNSILHLWPSDESRLSPKFVTWKRSDYIPEAGGSPLVRTSDDAWELQVEYPPVGNCYSIDFSVASSGDIDSTLANKARRVRGLLANLGKLGSTQAGENNPIAPVHDRLKSLYERIKQLGLGPGENEYFQITFMTYDDENHRMVVVDGLVEGGEAGPDMRNFWLPFGVGVAGACFKQADNGFYYVRSNAKNSENPDFYVDLPEKSKSRVLVSVPVDHPDRTPDSSIERSRQCIGVINISSENQGTKLAQVTTDENRRLELWQYCNRYASEILELIQNQ